jgi:hypothetical protein
MSSFALNGKNTIRQRAGGFIGSSSYSTANEKKGKNDNKPLVRRHVLVVNGKKK